MHHRQAVDWKEWLVNLGFQYLSCFWFAPYDTVATAGVRHTPACRCSHTQPLCRLNFHQSFPHAPTGVSEFAHCGRGDDSQKPTWQKETSQSWSAQALQGGVVQVGRHARGTRGCDALSTPWPKAWLKGSKNTSPWPNVGNCFHLPFLADSLSLLNVDNILYKFPCNSLFQKLSPVI